MKSESIHRDNKVLVSIITPAYNSARYLPDTIYSVQNQTFQNWELIVVDDASKDETCKVVENLMTNDSRIILLRQNENMGPSFARQQGIKIARGRFIAFLDSDDLWDEKKLTLQLRFMLENSYAFTCTAYEQIDEDGESRGHVLVPPEKADYDRVLLDCPIGNSTVMYDTQILGKCYGPDLKNREDYALWLKILKQEKYVFGLPIVLTKYRIRRGSQSRNKLKLVRYHWVLYRKVEHLSLIKSAYHILIWGLIKLLGIK